ncbi:hypothetical protein [Variovorax boronicumulans]|uniref:hypothetical protein n=1 Tax=Variovorax boronicumulans TaxID=436515 RepID=UPI0019811F61|nr:hypothetical protein [Variovorax boronicumulans]
MFRFFSEQVLPLVKARRANDRFAVARILKAHSPLISASALKQSKDTHASLVAVDELLTQLEGLWESHGDPSLLNILQFTARCNLLELPDALVVHGSGAIEAAAATSSAADEGEDRQSERDLAIQAFLKAPFSQVEPMAEYLAGEAHFDTHQGVKGLEFDRVMVVMDDMEARGFLFKYEDLFGGKAAGDKTVETTKRLFYVTASRAKRSLALVAYSSAPERIKSFVINQGWFDGEEVVMDVQRK